MRLDGSALGAAETVLVAANSHRLGGTGGFEMLAEASRIGRPGPRISDLLARHVAGRAVPGTARPVWQFAAAPGTRAWVETGPGSAARLGDAAGLGLRPLGATTRGFMRYELTL